MSAHHPAEDMLWDHYRGALKPGLDLVVRSHVERCSHCRNDLKLFDAVGAAMLDEVDGAAMGDNALELALARIERPEAPVAAPVRPARKTPAFLAGVDLPEALKAARIHGRHWVAPGVWLARVEVGDDVGSKGGPTYLMRVPPGMAMPVHTHRGRETTVVLKGGFKDDAHSYGVGDFVCCDEADCHSPATEADEDCICLIAQERPIVPLTWLGRILQPFARI